MGHLSKGATTAKQDSLESSIIQLYLLVARWPFPFPLLSPCPGLWMGQPGAASWVGSEDLVEDGLKSPSVGQAHRHRGNKEHMETGNTPPPTPCQAPAQIHREMED
jgi:hypothetical protein